MILPLKVSICELRKGEKLVTFLTIHFTFQFCVFSCQMLVASVSSQHDSEISEKKKADNCEENIHIEGTDANTTK